MNDTNDTMEKAIRKAYNQLPLHIQNGIKNVAILVENEPSREVREREGLREDETLLGYYQGIPLSDRGEAYGVGVTMPDTVTLYTGPIVATARDTGKELSRVVYETLIHEFAHHFGMDEEAVRVWEENHLTEL
jgi:predicted Zn-dependent protease with MMP-like domain